MTGRDGKHLLKEYEPAAADERQVKRRKSAPKWKFTEKWKSYAQIYPHLTVYGKSKHWYKITNDCTANVFVAQIFWQIHEVSSRKWNRIWNGLWIQNRGECHVSDWDWDRKSIEHLNVFRCFFGCGMMWRSHKLWDACCCYGVVFIVVVVVAVVVIVNIGVAVGL